MSYSETHILNLRGAKSILQTIAGKLSSINTKLSTIESGAQVNTVNSVNSKVGTVSLDYQDVNAAASNHTHNDKENISNKVTSISISSTDTQYPSAKCVYDIVGNIESILTVLLEGTSNNV